MKREELSKAAAALSNALKLAKHVLEGGHWVPTPGEKEGGFAGIKVTHLESGKISVRSPFDPSFPEKAKNLGGRWNPGSRVWVFDGRDEDDVRSLLVDKFGTDGSPVPVRDVKLNLDKTDLFDNTNEAFGLGRQLASRRFRDSAVRLGEGVRILTGGFQASGGTRSSPKLRPLPGTTLLVRDVPEGRAIKSKLEGLGSAMEE